MGAKGLLVSLPGMLLNPECFLPDNGLANLAGALLANDHDVVIWDFGTTDMMKEFFPDKFSEEIQKLSFGKDWDKRKDLLDSLYKYQEEIVVRNICNRIINYLKTNQSNFIGFKLWQGDGFLFTMQMTKMIKKECPGVMIMAGGSHVDIFRETVFDFPGNAIDVLAYSEGEKIISMLADYSIGKISLSCIPNIIYKENNRYIINNQEFITKLDELPYPAYDPRYYPAMEGNKKIKIITLDESRGCSCRCNFCIHPIKSGKIIREKSVNRIIFEIQRIKKETGSNQFMFAGSNTPVKFLIDFSKTILQRQIDIEFLTFAHINNYKRVSIRELECIKKAGCRTLFFGLESGSTYILNKSMNKGFTSETAKDVLKKVKSIGFDLIISLIFPAPYENDETEKDTMELISELNPNSLLVTIPGVFKGSEWAKNPLKYGIEIPDNFFYRFMVYKIKLLYPPQYWDDYTSNNIIINGRDMKELFNIQMKFREKIKEKGIPMNIAGVINSVANIMNKDKASYVAFWQKALFTGNYQVVMEEVKTINNIINKN